MKLKTCRHCKSKFQPARPLQVACGPLCALEYGRVRTAKEQVRAALQERRETRVKLDAMRSKPALVAAAQKAFNAFVRARDAGKPCISCDAVLVAGGVGGLTDCGHYRSVGSAPQNRFDETNAHAQCSRCNRYLSGNVVAYRAGLVKRIGLRQVERLEADQTLRKYTREGLIELTRYYRELVKEQKKEWV